MDALMKYKHHLIVLFALVAVKFVLVPLSENQLILQQKYKATQKRVNKVESLIEKEQQLLSIESQLKSELNKVKSVLYEASDEADFKILAQGNVEFAIKSAGCDIEQVGWDGVTQMSPQINRWHLKARYKGDANCLLKASRNIEALKPVIRIKEYFYGGKEIEKEPGRRVTAILNLIMWQQAQEVEI